MKKYLSTKYNETAWNFGLLIARLSFGGLMLHFGLNKLSNFATYKGMNVIFGSPVDLILVIFAELFCAAFVVLGLFTRFALIPLIITMGVAFFKAHDMVVYSNDCNKSGIVALMFMLAFLALLFTGPGKYSADRAISK